MGDDTAVRGADIDRFVRQAMAANGLPGLAVAITHRDDVVHLGAYGTAGDGRPMTARTQMFIGSLSKSLTALAVMQLVEAGEVELDGPSGDISRTSRSPTPARRSPSPSCSITPVAWPTAVFRR